MRRAPTQKQKVLQILIKDGGWIPTYGFENRLGIFVGHRGPARISELSFELPELIQVDSSENVYKYRLRFDNVHVALEKYPNWRQFLREELLKAGREFKEFKTVYDSIRLPDGTRVARPRRTLA